MILHRKVKEPAPEVLLSSAQEPHVVRLRFSLDFDSEAQLGVGEARETGVQLILRATRSNLDIHHPVRTTGHFHRVYADSVAAHSHDQRVALPAGAEAKVDRRA
jgi:hypothetical protein